MKISIVTPSFNQGRFIVEAIDSVMTQRAEAIEHIIVDNCSTDTTPNVFSRYPQLRIVCEKDNGQSDALNKGFKAATGDIIGWLNADDRYRPGCFRAVLEFMAANPDCDIVYGHYRLIDEAGKVICNRRELGFDLFMLKYLHILYIPSTTVFFRRRVFDDGNFLNIHYHYAMDYDFFLRLALKGYRFCRLPVFLADFRTYVESKSRQQTLKQDQEREQSLLEQDNFLANLKQPWRSMARWGLMKMAQSKRYALKLLQGAYL